MGESGASVVPIQLALTDASFDVPVTGYYGDATAQDLQSLSANPTGLLRRGNRGTVVAALQRALTRQGYRVAATGLIGPFTESLIKRYQADHGLPVTGAISLLQVEQTDPISVVAATADALIGTPYAWGGTGPGGFDCSGFVRYVFSKLGVDLPHSSYEQWSELTPVSASQNLEPGMLVFFSTYASGPSHVGIYLGGGLMVSASNLGVAFASLRSGYWASHYIGARQVLSA